MRAAAIATVGLLGLQLFGVEPTLAYLAPLLLIAGLLLLGRFPGERALTRALARRQRRRPPSSAPVPRPRFDFRLPRGGALVAWALAGRAPPVAGCAR